MSVFLARGRMRIQHDTDPKDALLAQIGDLSDLDLFYNQVLCAIYTMPNDAKTLGGLIVPTKTRDESIYQGRAGLVVKLGPQAFVDDETTKFYGQKADVGDWVFCRPSEGQLIEINGNAMRIFRDTQILGRIPNPDCVW